MSRGTQSTVNFWVKSALRMITARTKSTSHESLPLPGFVVFDPAGALPSRTQLPKPHFRRSAYCEFVNCMSLNARPWSASNGCLFVVIVQQTLPGVEGASRKKPFRAQFEVRHTASRTLRVYPSGSKIGIMTTTYSRNS